MTAGPVRLTVAQALVRFLAAQHVERDGVRTPFFAGCLGIFGHGNVAGMGEALLAHRDALPYLPGRNEQALAHIACGYARQRDRLATFAVTTSVGPGATNLVTGAALATINRLPLLLLPGDTFATRRPHPVLQQLESLSDGTVSVNDTLRPVSRYFDRIVRPEQLVPAALEAMRVLTDPAETGAVTLALPQDVQTEVVEVDPAFLAPRTWLIQRQPPAPEGLTRAVALIRAARRPLIVAGGGVVYSRATAALRDLVERTGMPVGETHAGRGALPSEHAGALGAIGVTGTPAANRLARDADLVIGIGTRWSDFTTSSKSAFQNPGVRFININVCAFDAAKHAGLQLVGDARVALEQLTAALGDHRVDASWSQRAEQEREAWSAEIARLVTPAPAAPGERAPLTQAAVIGAVNDAAGETGVVVQAAGSMPGDLHKLWRARDPDAKGYHVEYGYSCMGYEIPGGIGVQLAAPERRVFVLVGDGSYLMAPSELVTAVAQRARIVLVLVQNHGYASIGALSRSVGGAGFGTHHRVAGDDAGPVLDSGAGDALAGDARALPVDLAANVESLGVPVTRAADLDALRDALREARTAEGPVAIHVEVDRFAGVGGYESWWEVPVAAVSDRPEVIAARERYERDRRAQRTYLQTP